MIYLIFQNKDRTADILSRIRDICQQDVHHLIEINNVMLVIIFAL